MDGLYRAMGQEGRNNEMPQYCDACFSGNYPLALQDSQEKGNQKDLFTEYMLEESR